MVWLFAPIRKSLKCLLVIVIIFGFVSDCFLNLCFLQVDILQKLFPQKSKVGDSTQISDQYGTITCYTFLPHNNFLIQNTFLIHTKSWNRTFFFSVTQLVLVENYYCKILSFTQLDIASPLSTTNNFILLCFNVIERSLPKKWSKQNAGKMYIPVAKYIFL